MPAAGPYVAGIDLGTTCIKVGIFDADGNLAALAVREQALLLDGGHIEQDPAETWRLQCEAVREAVARAGIRPESLEAVALSVQRGTVIPLDDDGTPLANSIVWMDRRGQGQLDRVRSAIGAERYYDVAGHPLVPYTGVSKLLWLREDAAAVFERARVIAPPQTFHVHRLGGEGFLCDHSAGTFFAPFDIRRLDWSLDLLAALKLPVAKLPRVVPSVTVAGTLSPHAAGETGLSPRTRIVIGGGDGQCAAVGSGVTQPGRVMINIGTAAGVQVFLPRPQLDPRRVLNCGAHVVPGSWEMEGHTQASGAVFRWLRDELAPDQTARAAREGTSAYDLLVAEAAAVPPGAEGMVVLPTFNGSSAPVIRPEFRGAVIGLRLSHTRAHLVRAVLEGISMEIRWMLEAIREAGAQVDEVRLVGGGSHSSIWNQMHADILGLPVATLEAPDAAVTGAAVTAAVAMRYYPDFSAAASAFARVGRSFDPLPRHTGAYQDVYAAYRASFDALDEAGLFRSTAPRIVS